MIHFIVSVTLFYNSLWWKKSCYQYKGRVKAHKSVLANTLFHKIRAIYNRFKAFIRSFIVGIQRIR